ncbi:GntR family transcriptional regulator [Jatrophihabitans cynanchi]|uniref:GntR family transcriptional regulator n=1 Tax=Jatrophihabitans cynanchi TaxID=2944128 RepID=A0ABY7JVW5_9ACTN|nr:GntR family transcriptional regulator [Jatrophihabitans sp. SB3-54]WAX56681.1 GntR family transcriptional regulator [Jatrophihabitans sp. SB3-54]
MAKRSLDSEASGAERRLRYERVYDYVLELIKRERLKPGDRLPSAPELAERTGVSMISVRRGLEELEREGRVSRHQGVGTFVGSGRIVADPSRGGELLASLSDGSARPKLRTELLGITVGTTSHNIARALVIDASQPVWEVRRLRRVGGSAAILERAVLPLSRVPALDESYLRAGKSLYTYLAEQYGLRDDYVEQAIEVDRPSPADRQVLELGRTDHVVRIRGVSFDADGSAFDCYEQTYRATEFIFYSAGGTNRQLLQPGKAGEWLVRPLTAVTPASAPRRRR